MMDIPAAVPTKGVTAQGLSVMRSGGHQLRLQSPRRTSGLPSCVNRRPWQAQRVRGGWEVISLPIPPMATASLRTVCHRCCTPPQTIEVLHLFRCSTHTHTLNVSIHISSIFLAVRPMTMLEILRRQTHIQKQTDSHIHTHTELSFYHCTCIAPLTDHYHGSIFP